MKFRFSFLTLGLLLGLGTKAVTAAPAPAPPTPGKPELPLAKIPVILTAALEKATFDADEPVNLTVTLQYDGDKNLPVGTSAGFSHFDIVVKREEFDGKSIAIFNVARTSYGQEQLTSPDSGFGLIPYTLPPKGKQRVVFPLRRMFDLSSGGRFSVEVRRNFPVESTPTAPMPGENPESRSQSYRSTIEVKVAPKVSFSVEPPPVIEQELTPLPAGNF